MELKIRIETVWGKKVMYPTCEMGKRLAAWKGQITFLRSDVDALREMGYSFVVETPSIDGV